MGMTMNQDRILLVVGYYSFLYDPVSLLSQNCYARGCYTIVNGLANAMLPVSNNYTELNKL